MSNHRSIYGPWAGRFVSLEKCELWDETGYYEDEDTPELVPNYFGQTRAFAEYVGGSLIDLAGGCVGVVVREDLNGNILIAALDPDGEDWTTIAVWMEDSEGEPVGDNEPALFPFQPFGGVS